VADCSRHDQPTHGYRGCYWDLKQLALKGRDLSPQELAFVGVYPERSSTGGWHEPGSLDTYELDATIPSEYAEVLASPMRVGDSAERLDFLT